MAPVTLSIRRRFARLAAAAAVLAPLSVLAQVAPVEPFWAVPTAETTLRSGESEKFYPLARVKPETLLWVDAQGGGWSRVAYAPGMAVYVASDAVQPEPGGKSVRVVRPTHPRAAKLDTPRALGSWKPATEQPLPAGTVLALASPVAVEDAGGRTSYRVAAPLEARAFVPTASLARATPKQALTYCDGLRARGIVVPGMDAVTPAVLAAAPSGGAIGSQPGVQGTDASPRPADPGPRVLTAAEKLEQSFEAIRRQPILEAEVAELIAQYEKAIAEVENTALGARTRDQLQRRLLYLRTQERVQAEVRAIEASKPEIADEVARAAARLKDVENARVYNVVGRLSASALYDGKRLPLMYRVQSVGGPLARTLGYVKPEEPLKLQGKIGQIVGILGESRIDPTLKITIIEPRRVDVLTPEGTPVESPTDSAADAPPPPGGS